MCQIGVADGPFAAEQAARAGVRIPAGESASWLASLPVTALDRPELTSLLHRLGVHTLGAFAALPAEQVLARFGVDGARAHRMAGGQDDRPLAVRKPPPELTVRVDLEPPVDRVDTVAFSTRESAQRFVSGLSAHELVCTCLRLEIESEREEISRRCWRHPRGFSATEVVDRIRWQLQSVGQRPARGLAAPVTRVALIPEEVDRAGAFPEGLWGERAPDADVHRVLSRIQSMLGHTAVVTAVPSGGRGPAERVTLVPWGDQRTPDRLIDPPWPGQLPPPAPTQVWSPPRPTQVLAASGQPVEVDERAVVSAPPAWLVPALRAGDGAGGDMHGEGRSEPEPIVAWAGPWPVDERWWDASTARRRARFQVAVADGRAWLLAFEGGHWWIEAGYA